MPDQTAFSRRAVLRGLVAVAASPLLPTFTLPPPAAAAAPAATQPLLSYAVGTAGDWNWSAIKARNMHDAVEIWMGEQGYPDTCEAIADGETEDPCGDCDHCNNLHPDVVHHPEWDGHDVAIGERLWCEAGLGATCARCRDEAFLQEGGFFDAAGKLVCEECETPAEYAARLSEDVE